MKIAMMQPTFLPWQGMFELIYNADKFIFLDDFQYRPRSHHTSNKLFVAKDNVGFYSVNVCKNESQKVNLNETYLVLDTQWKNDILKRINFVYAKTPFYNKYYSIIKNWLLTNHKTLADLNISCIKDICNILGIKKQFLYSQNYTKETHSKATRTERICELLKWGGQNTTYLSAFGSFEYMKQDNYDYKKYPVLFQHYKPKPYKQIHSKEFIPYLSILDALFNIGAEATLQLIKMGTEKWLTFEEMDNLSTNKGNND